MRMALVISFTMAVTLACALTTDLASWQDDFRLRAIRITPPRPEMLAGYAGAEMCSGKRGDIRKIEWYVVPGPAFAFDDGRLLYGFADGRRIYLAEGQAHRVWLARHEALHTLGYGGSHDSVVFQAKCRAHWPYPSDTL